MNMNITDSEPEKCVISHFSLKHFCKEFSEMTTPDCLVAPRLRTFYVQTRQMESLFEFIFCALSERPIIHRTGFNEPTILCK